MTHSSDQWNSFHLCNRRKKGLHLSANLDINRFNVAIIPVSFCTSFGFRGGRKPLIALIWSGFTSIPLWVTMYPRNFPDPTLKEHLDAFRRSLCLFRISKMLERSARCSEKRHYFVVVVPYRSDESRFFQILCCQWYLMITLKSIQKTHPRMAYCCIY